MNKAETEEKGVVIIVKFSHASKVRSESAGSAKS